MRSMLLLFIAATDVPKDPCWRSYRPTCNLSTPITLVAIGWPWRHFKVLSPSSASACRSITDPHRCRHRSIGRWSNCYCSPDACWRRSTREMIWIVQFFFIGLYYNGCDTCCCSSALDAYISGLQNIDCLSYAVRDALFYLDCFA